ncbi:5-methylthioadenosine/S-adenosylhomocysteine deaminase [Cohnella xylanilytica]|uniref:5-methylthioadenosine/S-adenosylhomocysteine deaminase n=1 Tax=Cohnella xylanilytica TaxID=557555 RepID=A0A841TW67_9BACL|nr:amidohydrolase [Cohnella xylanilytica]MBB6690211.1 amidohydrolase [Cohnella xylanilytica]GIO11642.1 5-methylthioadenosine/S-adenosylhomocysteine deaminase [Cohnella xylanilytica]
MNRWLIENGTLVTMDPAAPIVHGWLAVEGSAIAGMGAGEAPEEEKRKARETVNGKGLLFLPGLVNTHGHAAMSLLRGLADDLALQDWLENHMWPMEAKFTGDDVYWGSSLAAAEMILSGTTTFVDMYDHMDRVAQVVEASGLRASLTRGVIGLCPPDVQTAKLNDAIQFARDWHGKADGRIQAMMSPHAPYTCPPDYIERIVAAAHELGLPLHTHMSESAAEVAQNVKDYGVRPVEHLDRLGLFSRPALVAHAVHLTDEEIALLAERGVAVSHNPVSNLKLASGVARVPDLLRAGVTVSLGTDSAASNNNLDLFEEIRLAALLHKGVSGDPTAVPAAEALRMGTVYGAKSIGLEGQVGMLKPGMKADLIAVSIAKPHFVPATDYVSHLVYAASGADVAHVWVDGKQLLRDRELLTLDIERIRFEAQRSFERLRG